MTKETLTKILSLAVSALCRDVNAWMDYFRHGCSKPMASLALHFKEGQSSILAALDMYAAEPSEGESTLTVEGFSECEILLENYIVNVKPESRKANGKAGDVRAIRKAFFDILAFFGQRGILSSHDKLKYFEKRDNLVAKMNKLVEPIELRETRRVSFVDDGSEKIGRFLVSPDRSMIKDTIRGLSYSGMATTDFQKYIRPLLTDYASHGVGVYPGTGSTIRKAFQRGDCARFGADQVRHKKERGINDTTFKTIWWIIPDEEISKVQLSQ